MFVLQQTYTIMVLCHTLTVMALVRPSSKKNMAVNMEAEKRVETANTQGGYKAEKIIPVLRYSFESWGESSVIVSNDITYRPNVLQRNMTAADHTD